MKLAASIGRSLQADMQAELRDMERAVVSGTRDAGRGLKTELRRQIGSAGLGQRLARTWRDSLVPSRGKETYGAPLTVAHPKRGPTCYDSQATGRAARWSARGKRSDGSEQTFGGVRPASCTSAE